MLFIDEAYSLSRSRGEELRARNSRHLVKLMEDHRGDTAVIVAGYPEEMAQVNAHCTHPAGLRSFAGCR